MPAPKPILEAVPDVVPAAPAIDPIPGDLRAVLELFAGELSGVGFPGVDAAVLRRHADEVRAVAVDVERARAALDTALALLDERSRALAAVAQRGIAYAAIYAADQPALAARLAALGGAPAVATAPVMEKRPRGRPRKNPPQLPLDRGDTRAEGNTDGGGEAPAH
jgi:hypothetical protein